MSSRGKLKTHARNSVRREPLIPSGIARISESAVLRDRKRSLLLAGFLAIATLILYSPVGHHPFINYDDQSYVFENAHIKAGLTWNTFLWSLTSTEASNWHPVTWLSHALDCQIYGLNPAGHHWTNAIFHALNAGLLFLLLWRVTGATWRSLLVASLFALHPLNVESVAWVAERKNVLSTFFFLLALGAYGYYCRKPGIRRYILLAFLFVLALASKPMVITLPFVLLLLDFWPLGRIAGWSDPSPAFPLPQRTFSRLVVEKLPLLALSAASALITVLAQKEAEVSVMSLPLTVRLEDSLYAYGVYLWKALWPVHLSLIYPHPGRTLALWQPLVSALIITIALLVAWTERRTRPYLMTGILWFLGTAVPIIGIVQVGVQVVADRYAYVILIGVFVAAVWGISSLADQWHAAPTARILVTSLILAALTVSSWHQIGYWQSTVDVWTHALAVTKNNSMAESFLGNELISLGRYEEGIVHLRTYVRMEPLDPTAHIQVAADFQDRGQLQEALHEYDAALRAVATLQTYGSPSLEPKALALTYANLAVIHAQLGEFALAQQNAKKAAETDGDAVGDMINGLAGYIQQNPASAGYVRLGYLLQLFGYAPEAERAFARARMLDQGLSLPVNAQAAR